MKIILSACICLLLFLPLGPPARPAAARAAAEPVPYDCSLQEQISVIECEALVTLYNATSTPGWKIKNNWLANIYPCGWWGVGCIEEHVYTLSLGNNQLTGPIPPELAHLTYLVDLDLSDNQLNGNIPTALGGMVRLKTLLLSGNPLTGSIPASLSGLSELTTLTIGPSQLSGGIPAELGSLKKLRSLVLTGSQFTGSIPSSLSTLPALETLNLSGNLLSGGIPPALSNLTGLETLNLSGNRFSGVLPGQIGGMHSLKSLEVQNNPLAGPLPLALHNLSLNRFSYSNTQLCEPPEPEFYTWLSSIKFVDRTDMRCALVFMPVIHVNR